MLNLRLNLIALLLVGVLVFLQYRLWVEPGGVRDVLALKKSLAQQTQDNDKLKKRNDELTFQIERLQNSQDATESRARNELGMIKKGETFYQVTK